MIGEEGNTSLLIGEGGKGDNASFMRKVDGILFVCTSMFDIIVEGNTVAPKVSMG